MMPDRWWLWVLAIWHERAAIRALLKLRAATDHAERYHRHVAACRRARERMAQKA